MRCLHPSVAEVVLSVVGKSVCLQSQWEYHYTITCFCTVYMQNTTPTTSVVINSDESFLMCMFQTWKQFSNIRVLIGHTMGTGPFPGVKRPGRGIDHPPPSSAKVKERVELYLYSPSGPSWPVLGWTLPLLIGLKKQDTFWTGRDMQKTHANMKN
jgi:hypothetical protein